MGDKNKPMRKKQIKPKNIESGMPTLKDTPLIPPKKTNKPVAK